MSAHQQPVDPTALWPRVVLGATFALILAACLFPYQLEPRSAPHLSSDLISTGEGVVDALRDLFLNVLLFLPFGMGVTATARQHGAPSIADALLVLAASVVLSLAVEGLQTLLPSRDPSLRDVVANTSGALLGRFALLRWQDGVSTICRAIGHRWRRLWLIRWPGRALCVYFALALLTAGLLQARTRLSDWSSEYPLLIGNEATGDRPWSGWIRLLEIGDRAFSARQVEAAVSTSLDQVLPGSLIVSHRFTDGQPGSAAAGFVWRGPGSPGPADLSRLGLPLSGTRWPESKTSGRRITEALRRTNQLTLKLVCRPADPYQDGPARIVSISIDPSHRNLTIGQEGSALVARLRTPLTGPNGREPELVKPNVFAQGVNRTILVTYDGSTLTAFVDGPDDSSHLELSPGAALAQLVLAPAAPDLPGYALLFMALVFIPAGILLALTLRGRVRVGAALLLAVGGLSLLLAGALELVLILTSGRFLELGHVLTGTALCSGAAGCALHFRDP